MSFDIIPSNEEDHTILIFHASITANSERNYELVSYLSLIRNLDTCYCIISCAAQA